MIAGDFAMTLMVCVARIPMERGDESVENELVYPKLGRTRTGPGLILTDTGPSVAQ